MKIKPIIVVPGQSKSIFFEIFFKSLKQAKFKSPLIIISTFKILRKEMKKFNSKKNIRLLDHKKLKDYHLDNKSINLVDVNSNDRRKYSNKSNMYIQSCFDTSFSIIRSNLTHKFINGPINKYSFLNKKFLGITEYISKKFNIKKIAMLIYNKKLSVCPITTHLPIKLVSKRINKKMIIDKVTLINDFYMKVHGFRPKIAITGLNPHCESILKFNEDTKIIEPSIKYLQKKRFKVQGPFSADTIFLKKNRKKFNVIIGMYHDQVLAPLKTVYEYDAINITLGLPFLRVSPDHGPNKEMINKNLSNPQSLIEAIKFLDTK